MLHVLVLFIKNCQLRTSTADAKNKMASALHWLDSLLGAVNSGLCNRCPRQGVERPFYPPLFSFWRMVGWLMSRAGEAGLPTIVRGEVKPSYSFRGEW